MPRRLLLARWRAICLPPVLWLGLRKADLTDTGTDQSFTLDAVAPLNTTDFHTSKDEGHLHHAQLSIPGVAQKSSFDLPTISGSKYADFNSAEALAKRFEDAVRHPSI